MNGGLPSVILDQAVQKLLLVYERSKTHPDFIKMFQASGEVIPRYQKIFCLDHLPELTKDEFQSFLLFENNQHWTPLYRQQSMITQDMDALRSALMYLVDENVGVEARLEKLRPSGKDPWIKGLSRSIITPILLITNPDKYGVWNGTAEGAMKELGIFPNFPRGSSFAQKYVLINEVLLHLSKELNLDLWVLDALWWGIGKEEAEDIVEETDRDYSPVFGRQAGFGLERYLQEFIFENWENIKELGDWTLFEEEDEVVGKEYPAGDVGRIDLLARHKTDSKWLVVELKRSQASDETMGQVQRYMGWVSENLAEDTDEVYGLIIAREMSDRLRYALKVSSRIDFMRYEVEFSLKR